MKASRHRPPWLTPSILAPLEGVGHPAWRALATEPGGVGLVCTEFVSIGGAPFGPASLARQVVHVPGIPLSVQLLGQDPERLAAAAAQVAAAGADVVDLNLGCPARGVVGRGAGAALLRDPERLEALVRRVRDAVPGCLSAKMRAGFDASDQAEEIAERLQDAGIDFLTVHPRCRADHYTGVADWRLIRSLAARLRIPVVGNGDLWYAGDAVRLQAASGCAAVMLGRGAIRNPWIFAQIAALRAGTAPPTPRGADLVAYLQRVVARYREALPGERLVTGKLKELVRYLGRAVRDGGGFRLAALRSGSADDILECADRLLAHLDPADLDLHAEGPGRLERSAELSPP
jgi:nifR3 family TIM-barrel protein